MTSTWDKGNASWDHGTSAWDVRQPTWDEGATVWDDGATLWDRPARGVYRQIRDAIVERWNNVWPNQLIEVSWRSNQVLKAFDPAFGGHNGNGTSHFLRNEIDFGRESVIAFGGGAGKNQRVQYGSVMLRLFTSILIGDEDEALDLMDDATAVFRSYRSVDTQTGNDLSFIGEGSGFDWGPDENGVWFVRGALTVFEYRFLG
jgi:hypothetical protein